MFLKNKKGLGLLIFVGLGILFSTIALIITSPDVDFKESIGMKQYNLLTVNERIEASQGYIDEALIYSADNAIDKLFRTSGIYTEESSSGLSFYSQCGVHIYPLYNNRLFSCLPEFRSTYKSYVKQNMKRYMDAYDLLPLQFSYFLDIISKSSSITKIKGTSMTSNHISLATKAEFMDEKKVYPRGVLGGYGNEKQTTCSSGDCLSGVVKYYHELYLLSGFTFSYVHGGESPYTYKDTKKDQLENKKSIFRTIDVTAVQPDRYKFTEPGFDSAGWIWWVGYHSGIPQLQLRKEIDVYYASMLAGENIICGADNSNAPTCDRSTILELAKPGDILFVQENNVPVHMMIYLGDSKVSHSRGSTGLTIEVLPVDYVSTSYSDIMAVFRLNYPSSNKKSIFEIDSTIKQDGNSQSCLLPIDFSQINKDAIHGKRINVDQLLTKLQQHNRLVALESAKHQFPKVPTELVLAIMRTEIGNVDNYLSGTTGKSSQGMAGPMQISQDTCKGVYRLYSICDYNEIVDGDVDQGIISGAAVLNNIIRNNKYIDDQRPNYYFVALAYNAGQGSLNKILETANERTKIPISLLQWQDIQYADVMNGMKKLNLGWANTKSKWDEVFEYPNLVAEGLSQQCEGSLLASYQTKASNINFKSTFFTEVSLDIVAMELLSSFVDELLSCDNNLDDCVINKLIKFNEKNSPLVSISKGSEDDVLAYDFVDELLNCYANDQTNCICSFSSLEQNSEHLSSSDLGISNTDCDVYSSDDNCDQDSLIVDESKLNSVNISLDQFGNVDIGYLKNGEFISKDKLMILPFVNPNLRVGDDSDYSEDALFIHLDGKSYQHSILKKDQETWVVGKDMSSLALAKEGDFSLQLLETNSRQQLIVDYAKEYLGTPYHVGEGLRDCTAYGAQQDICATQCGSFVSSVFLYTLGTSQQFGPSIVPRGNGIDKCDHSTMNILPESEWSRLQPGDVFSSTGSTIYGHTGIYVGKGILKDTARAKSDGSAYCFKTFISDPTGQDVFIHSIGPVCYNYRSDLITPREKGGQGRIIEKICRHQLLIGADQDEMQTVEQTDNAKNPVPLQWIKYDETNHAQFLCRNNKHFYRFQVEFSFTEKNFGFSLYLNDTKDPINVVDKTQSLRKCGLQDVAILEWDVLEESEPIYSFDLFLRNETVEELPLQIIEQTAEETDISNPEELTKINKLYKKEKNGATTYYYLINRFAGDLLQSSATYEYNIIPMDQFSHQAKIDMNNYVEINIPFNLVDTAFGDTGWGYGLDFMDQLILGECEDVSGVDGGMFFKNDYADSLNEVLDEIIS